MMAEDATLSLIGAQKAEFKHAAKVRSWLLRTQLAIGTLSAATVFIANEKLLYLAALVGLSGTAIWLYLALELSRSRSHAERLRRTTLVVGGFGLPLSGAELIELRNEGRASQAEATRLIDPEYFASMAPPGLPRFLEMLRESAIWTANLAGFAAQEAWMVFGLSVMSIVLTLFAGATLLDNDAWQYAARVLFAMLAVLLSADFLGSAIAYGECKRSVQRIIDRVSFMRTHGTTPEQAMILFGDYNAAVEPMPVFPEGLYARHEARLNEQYRMYLTGPR